MRRLWWYLLVAPFCAMGMTAGAVLGLSPSALAPGLESDQPELSKVTSIDELYQLRDRLQRSFTNQSPTLISSTTGVSSAPQSLVRSLQAVDIRIQLEEKSKEKWNEAIRQANEATELGAKGDRTEATTAKIYSLWKEAVNALEEVSGESLLAKQAAQKLTEYEPNLGVAAYNYDTARSGFLQAIADSSGMGDRVRITVCSLQRECRRLRGNEPPASPASLIKVPIAVALMAKLTEENISVDTPIYIDPDNWTEDAAKIWVGEKYPLRKVVQQMISYSSNIATNQLIDYLGWDYINQTLRDRGYRMTRVNNKLVGQSTYPANLGSPPNVMTTDEITDMMVGIYNGEHPGDDVILEGLVNQYDWELGYEAVKRPAVWIGEKTGQNSKMLGTTVGVNIKGDRYIITVTIDYTASEPAVKKVVKGVVDHLVQHQGF